MKTAYDVLPARQN